ncbi:MAG: ferrous iron transport protein B [Pirellulales bacterium]
MSTLQKKSAHPPVAGPLKVAMIGNPNTGKSTLFNALAGMHSRVGNFPGCTVEKKIGRVRWEGRRVELIDLPGTYSLSPRSLDELVSVEVLLGRQKEIGAIDGVVCIVDASNLERNLYLVSQVFDLGLPTVVVLNMADVAAARGNQINEQKLSEKLGVPVIKTEAHRRRGLDAVREAILHVSDLPPAERPKLYPAEFYAAVERVQAELAGWNGQPMPNYLVERMVMDVGGEIEMELVARHPQKLAPLLKQVRQELREGDCRIPGVEARVRYAWAREMLDGAIERPAETVATISDKIDRLLTSRFVGLLMFAAIMFVVFMSIFAWAEPLMGYFEGAQEWAAGLVTANMAPGALRSLIVDGVIAGVGGVLVFLPQIALLFLFIAILEDCGYMARAAFLMDKLMSRVGLSGKSFVPLMSSFACAIPGVMATRVIENRRDRMVTILVAPLMSCSARLPVYILMIALFLPQEAVWKKGGVMFAMYSLGVIVAIGVAWLLRKTLFKGETPPFVMELPSYKLPSVRMVAHRVYDRSKAFVTRAGTLIFATTIVVWAALYFPGDHTEEHALQAKIESIEADIDEPLTAAEKQLGQLVTRRDGYQILLAKDVRDDKKAAVHKALEKEFKEAVPTDEAALAEDVAELDVAIAVVEAEIASLQARLEPLHEQKNAVSARLIESSLLGRLGHTIEPAVRPLGWDWKIGVGAIASFPAREVIIATLGTIYSLGGDVDEEDESLRATMAAATWPDGRPVYTIPVLFSVMVFFALCAQCAATLMVIKRETNSWRWPAFTFVYMTALAYIAALLTYQIGSMIV